MNFRDGSNETALGEPAQQMEYSFSMILSSNGILARPNYSTISICSGLCAVRHIGRLSLRSPISALRRVPGLRHDVQLLDHAFIANSLGSLFIKED